MLDNLLICFLVGHLTIMSLRLLVTAFGPNLGGLIIIMMPWLRMTNWNGGLILM